MQIKEAKFAIIKLMESFHTPLFEKTRQKLAEVAKPSAEKLEPSLRSAKENFEKFMWEKHRKPQLLRQFERGGLAEPEKAVETVRFLEGYVRRPFNYKERYRPNQKWRYQPKDIGLVQKITAGMAEPAQTLGKLAQFIDFSDGFYLSDFADYVSLVKNHPRFHQALDKLQPLAGSIAKLHMCDMILEDGQVSFNAYQAPDRQSDVHLPDLLSQFFNLTAEEFENLLSQENINRLAELGKTISKNSYADKDVLHAGHIVDLLRVVADETKTQMLMDSLKKKLRWSASAAMVGKAAQRIVVLTEKVPQLSELYQTGFNIDDYLEFNDAVSIDAEIAAWGNYPEEFGKILADERLCANARLLKKFGPIHVEMQASGSNYYDFWREMETESLEKLLTVASAILPEDKKNRHELFSLMTDITLNELTLADLHEAMAVLPQGNGDKIFFWSILSPLLAHCKGGQELKRRIEIAKLPEFQAAVKHEEFMDAMGATRHGAKGSDAVVLQAFSDPDGFLRLWENREQSMQRCDKLMSNSNLTWKTDLETLIAINDLSEADFAKLQTIIGHLHLEPDLMKKVKVILSMNEEEIDSIDNHLRSLRQGEFKGVLDPRLTHDELHAICTMPKKSREWFFVVFDHVLTNKDFFLTDSDIDLTALSIFFYRHPDAGDVFESMTFNHRKAAAMLIDDKWNDPDFEFGQYFDEAGNVKPPLIEYFYARREINHCFDLLNDEIIEAMPAKDKEFWTFARKYGSQPPALSEYLISLRPDFDKVCPQGEPTEEYLAGAIEAGLSRYPQKLLNDETLNSFFSSFPEPSKPFWQYYAAQDLNTKTTFVFEHRQDFAKLIIDGQETAYFWELFSRENPRYFVDNATRDQWKMAFGEAPVNQLLAVLPKRTDERRNAFTHGEFDRTSKFIQHLVGHADSDFVLTPEDFQVMTAYVARFGLAENVMIFRYFKHLYLHEQKGTELPEEIRQSGVLTTENLEQQLARVRGVAYSKEPLTDLSKFSAFEIQVLDLITGKSTHTFRDGRPELTRIIHDFQEDYREGRVTPTSPEYQSDTLELFDARIEFDKAAVKDDYELFQEEILAGIDAPEDAAPLKIAVGTMVEKKISQLQTVLASASGPKAEGINRNLQKFVEFQGQLEKAQNIDDLMLILLTSNLSIDGEDKRLVQSVERQIVLRKVFIKHYPAEKKERLKVLLENEISGQAVLAVTDLVNELAKTHALNMAGNNEEGYWRGDVFAKMKALKQGKELPLLFNPAIERLKKETEKFKIVQTGARKKLEMIPDRGFIGEMSGYLANVCYTKEYPFLSRWKNVVPYKFVVDNDLSGVEFVGSVLVFEVEDEHGATALLVRAFDMPEEEKYDVRFIIEQFLDKMATVAKKRGAKTVLVPGNEAAMSNYTMTKNHMLTRYVSEKTPVSLKNEFVFNGYDLTKNCYAARVVD